MNIDDLYSSRIQKTFDEDHSEIFSILKANPRKVLKLISYYKGLPLSYPATITSIDRGAVDLDVQAEQAFTIEQSRAVFIRSPLFRLDVLAQVQYVNIRKQAASFVKFSYVEIMAERRSFIRMRPDPSPEVEIETVTETLEGNLFDVSLSGLNVSVNHFCPLEPATELSVSFVIGSKDLNHDFKVCTPARLIAIEGDAAPYSYKFSICPDKLLERHLSQYIFQRQIEIIKEIKDAAR